jgi:5'-nucleotidase (lipoprotein e(P4) family)
MRKGSWYWTLVCVGLTCSILLCGCSAFRTGCGNRKDCRRSHELLNATLWVQTAAEYDAACLEIYRLAGIRLDEALADESWTAALEQDGAYQELPPAVVVDVDETVLDNSAFEAKLTLAEKDYNKPMWDAWVAEAKADEIPGAQEFIQSAFDRGAEVFFVTNRSYKNEAHTVRNLRERFGPAISAGQVLSKYEQTGWTSDKTSRRAHVAKSYRILLLVGDDFNDFAYLGKASPDKRVEVAREYSEYWGTKWILLPNPLYGGWEQALYGYDRDMEDDKKLDLKYKSLDPME